MDNRGEVHGFLESRRARISPQEAGLVSHGQRRVAGLRREEVAQLAGVTTDYYARMERGNLRGASDSVLEALAKALRLDEAERAHLLDLARAANSSTRHVRRRSATPPIRAGLQQFLDAMTGVAALVHDARLDFLATNNLGRALCSSMFEAPARGNSARFVFLDERSVDFYSNWDEAADEIVAILRSAAGHDPYDKGLTELVGELSTLSQDFRIRWAAHEVRRHRMGAKQVHHPVVGDLTLSYEVLQLGADTGLTLNAFTAAPASASAEALTLLASWSATEHQPAPAGAEPRPT